MSLLIKHIASGQAFFTGVGLLCLAVLMTRAASPRRRWASVAWACGLLLVGVSATPLPWSYYILAAAISLAWIVSIRLPVRSAKSGDTTRADGAEEQPLPRRARVVTGLFLLVWLVGAGMELPYHLTPAIPKSSESRLTIFADSVTAGIGEREAVTWPQLFADAHAVEVVDHSRMGATAASATLLAQQHPPAPGIVLLEIGGNDFFGTTTAAEFERTLNGLLQSTNGQGRQIVMLELPLPPLFNDYGRIQRRLAKRYGVSLIPKRFLLDVLLSETTTLDTIHLSQAGHRQMAERMWELLEPSY